MNINEKDIVGTYKLSDGSKYIFLVDDTVYREACDGKLKKIELTKSNIKKIQDEIGIRKTDIII